MSSLYENKFKIIRGIVSKETSLVLFNYLQMKAHVWKTMTKAEYLGDKRIMGVTMFKFQERGVVMVILQWIQF